MRILIETDLFVPAIKYGGIERGLWWLAKALNDQGHDVTFLAAPGSYCPFGKVIERDPSKPLAEQIPADIDIAHFNSAYDIQCPIPHIFTFHCNAGPGTQLPQNTVFLTQNHAERYGAEYFIHYGLDLDEYGDPALSAPRENVVFLAKAAWRVKNVAGAIRMARKAGVTIEVAGGTRLNFKMGFRFTADPNAKFLGMVDQENKLKLLRRTEALLFPVVWHEPFGAAIIEAMYFGQPVFGGIWGSLPELVKPDVGFCSDSESELVQAIQNREQYNRQHIHQYVCDQFNNQRMAKDYLAAYETVLNGGMLNRQIPIKPDIVEPKRFSMRA